MQSEACEHLYRGSRTGVGRGVKVEVERVLVGWRVVWRKLLACTALVGTDFVSSCREAHSGARSTTATAAQQAANTVKSMHFILGASAGMNADDEQMFERSRTRHLRPGLIYPKARKTARNTV
jgi:hypothetical protein